MDVPYSEFLDETSSSQLTRSPAKTSTVAKDDIKWNEDAFFKRQGFPKASESLFVTPSESPISASNKPMSSKEILEKPKFDLNGSSFLSSKADSSLGILNVENFSGLSDSSFQSTRSPKKQKKTKKLERRPRITSEDLSATFKERMSAVTRDLIADLENSIKEYTDAGSNSSSDIEYDGTNIPELNMDCDILALIRSEKSSFIECDSTSKNDESQHAKSVTFTKKEKDLSESCSSSSELVKNKLSDFSSRQSTGNTRNSIFDNFKSSYESLYESIVPDIKSKKEKASKTIKVCPFLNMSSFEIEPILHKSAETTVISSIENTRCNQELSLDFCPEQISARSSSFKSSVKSDSSTSETPNISLQSKNSFHLPMFSPKEDLENEVLSGSHLQIPEMKFESMNVSFGNSESKNSRQSSKYSSSLATKNISENMSRLSEHYLEPKIPLENSFGLVTDNENWCSQLGVSESDFFSSETAKEMLQKDEKEQLLGTNKISGISNWSPPSQLEVTAPSWFAELSSSEQLDSGGHISIGTLFKARSEKLGSLSSDKEIDRPYFGTEATTPPKPEEVVYSEATKTSADNSPPFEDKNIRASTLSELLDDISLSDPVTFASKIENKFAIFKKSEYENSERSSKVSDKSEINNMKEIDTSVRSSDNNISRRTHTDASVGCKSTVEESDASTLNYSVQSSSDGGSVKTVKCGLTCCSQSSSQQGITEEFSRPSSACSSTCSTHIPIEKALSLPYGCMKYLSSGVENHQNGVANSLQTGSCSHVCLHTAQPNLLHFGAFNPLHPLIQNTLSAPAFLSGTSVTCNGIQAPSELYFPEKIALGDSQELIMTIRNSTNIAYYRILSVSAYLNDSPLPEGMSGLNFSNTVPCSVGNATDIKLIIAPKYEGKFEVNLQVDAFINLLGQTLNSTPSATVKTKIQYTVVRPSVSILYKGKRCLNLGTIITGSSFVEYVTIINNSDVSVPLRINLSNETAENQIYFGLKEMDRQKHPSLLGSFKFLSPTVLLYRLPATKNKNMPTSLNIPVVFESISSPVHSSITAAIETPTVIESLDFIKISGAVGNARLILKDTDQTPLVLKASKGGTCSHSVTVMNDGSVSVVYDITIESEDDVLSVSPTTLNLQPKQCAIISVIFRPQTYCTIKGNLLAAAEPHGQVFVLAEIIGIVKENYTSKSQNNNHPDHNLTPTRDSFDAVSEASDRIECNKQYLTWGGSDIGSINIKTCTLRKTKKEPVQVKIFIKQKDKVFMLLNESNQETTNYILNINAEEGKDLSVIFKPKDVKSYSGQLYIKPLTPNETSVFMIPLSGYGGTSDLKILDLSCGDRGDYYMDVDATVGTDNVYKNIIFHNVGLRPAFVKLYPTYDNLIENVVLNQIVISPSEFVLLQDEKRNVLISINGLQKKKISQNEIMNVLYGDEILRQRMKRISKSTSADSDIASNKSFTAYFDGEEKVSFDPTYRSSTKDEILFHISLKKIKIHVFFNRLNASFSRRSFAPLCEIQDNFSNITLDSTIVSSSSLSSNLRRLTIESHSPPVKDSTAYNISRLSLPIPYSDNSTNSFSSDDTLPSVVNELNNLKLNMWSVHPEELVIDADNKERRILLKNNSDSDMRFRVECAIDIITVSPVSGILSSRGEIGLRLTLISANYNKLLDDYCGNIKILCDSEEKNVSVLVMKDKKGRSSSPLPVALYDSTRSGFLSESNFLENTVIESTSRSLHIDNIFKFPKEIALYASKVGIVAETLLVVGNPIKETVIWNIFPSSMLFTEPYDDSIDSRHSVFGFKNNNGVIKPMSTENIVIQFFPRSAGCFQQFFNLNLNSKAGNQLINIKVKGEIEVDSSIRCSGVTDKNKHTITVKKKTKSEIFSASDVCEFPVTVSGQKSKEDVVIKNVSSQDIKLSVIKPSLPFSINISSYTVRSKRYCRMPVYFKPLKAGKFESEIKFISEKQHEIKVRLVGLSIT